jgi:hypothetical protein
VSSGRRQRALLLATGLCVAAAGLSIVRRHAVTPAQRAEKELQLGVADEANALFPRALDHYRACLAGAPGSRPARTARARITWIEQRAEGGFVPLVTLAQLRRDPAPLADPLALSRLAAQTESFPAGLVRSELRLRIGEAWLKLPGHGREGVAALRALVSDPSSGAADRRVAERDLVEAGRLAGSLTYFP